VAIETYNEPLVTTEWPVDIFKTTKQARFTTGFVANGTATPKTFNFL
jgi:pyruvate-formate lyase-activating enzyme